MVYSFDTNIMQNAIDLKARLCQNNYTMIEETWGGDGMEYIDPVLIELEKFVVRFDYKDS